jgi:hypothetical protein
VTTVASTAIATIRRVVLSSQRPFGRNQRHASQGMNGSAAKRPLWRKPAPSAIKPKAITMSTRDGRLDSRINTPLASRKATSKPTSFHTCASNPIIGGHRPMPRIASTIVHRLRVACAATRASAAQYASANSAKSPPGPGMTRSVTLQSIAINGGWCVSNWPVRAW